ncbi:MAG: SHOCT domain-containing protein [Caulobacteraceae bacterium]
MWGPMMGYGYGGAWMMTASAIFWIALVALAAVLIWRLSGQRGPGQSGAPHSGMQVLDQRYARGEIQRDEYLQKRADLFGPGASPSQGGL